MSYFTDIKYYIDSHLWDLENIASKEMLTIKSLNHLNRTIDISSKINSQKPEDCRCLIEFIESESRVFGWSYPENSIEEKYENFFWKFKDSIKAIIRSMTARERLYFFDYLAEYEALKPIERQAREYIERILFIEV